MPALKLDKICKSFGKVEVLKDIDLTVEQGEFVVFVGPSGCGKSTLLRLIAGLLHATAGSIQTEGRIALADENLALDANLTVEKALMFWADMDGASANDRSAALADMDLQALSQVPVRFLSTGQRKRACIARVLTSKADIWLLDEPYNGLDSASCARLDHAITAHAASGGIVLVAAHQPPSINVAHSLILDRPGADG